MDNLTTDEKKLDEDVKESLIEPSKNLNESLRNYIYYEKKLNLNQVAEMTGHSRQYLWAVMNRRMKASYKFARQVCDVLGVKEINTLFRQDDIEQPNFLNLEKKYNVQ